MSAFGCPARLAEAREVYRISGMFPLAKRVDVHRGSQLAEWNTLERRETMSRQRSTCCHRPAE
jgi:hypothetical protein